MNRRDFLKTSLSLAVLGSVSRLAGPLSAGEGAAKETEAVSGPPDLVAVRGGAPADMFERAMKELGGLSRFVKPGQTVTVKPNIAWDQPPEMAANTNPELVAAIVRACFAAGAARVQIFDTTCNDWDASYEHSGIRAAAEKAGAVVVGGDSARDPVYRKEYYREVPVPKGEILKKLEVHRFIPDCDVLINVPVLKVHGGAVMTCCMKNTMGFVSKQWQRHFHQHGLQQCIAECASVRPPDLNIVDASRVMIRRGPRGVDRSDVRELGYLLAGRDMVALDAAAARILELPQRKIGHIAAGEALGLGTSDLGKLNIKRIRM